MIANRRIYLPALALLAIVMLMVAVTIIRGTDGPQGYRTKCVDDVATRLAVRRPDIRSIQLDTLYESRLITDPKRIEQYRKALANAVIPELPPGGMVSTLYVTYKDGKQYGRYFGYYHWSWAFSEDFVKLFNEDFPNERIPMRPPPLPDGSQ